MSVVAPQGFRAAGVAAGIKAPVDGTAPLDLAVVAGDAPGPVSAVFTRSRTAAAPVHVSRRHVADGRAQAVVINSGCANAATGDGGRADAIRMAERTAAALGCAPTDVLVCSTGPIGPRLPMTAVESGIEAAVADLGRTAAHGRRAAEAILTTDTVAKEVVVDGGGFRVGGMAKGAGMLRPDMATMLAVLTTDAAVEPDDLWRTLVGVSAVTFNALDVDGCTSTNDTVALLASGAAGPVDLDRFGEALEEACRLLARALADDAEGATRVVELTVSGAPDRGSALALGRAVADSALVRSSFWSGDPNWGRIVAALGAAPVPVDPDAISVRYEGTFVCRDGVGVPVDLEALRARLATGDLRVEVRVGHGPGRITLLTTDLTPEYVRFNGEPS